MSGGEVLERSSEDRPFRLILQLSVFAVVAALLMLLTPELPLSAKLFIIALVLLTLKHWGGVLVLLPVQADLFFREGSRFAGLRGPSGIVFVFIVVTVLMFVARQRQVLSQIVGGSVFNLLKDLSSRSTARHETADERSGSPLLLRMATSAIRGVALLLCCTIAARVLLACLPDSRELQGNLRDLTEIDPTMSAAATLVISLVATWLVVSEIAWRHLTPAQSRVLLRSVFLKIHYRDLRMIVLRRLKQRRRRAAAKKQK